MKSIKPYMFLIAIISMPTLKIFSQTASSSSISRGGKLPEIKNCKLINDVHSRINLGDLKGKLVIIDFWATWCKPCLSFFKVADSLQKKFGDKIIILPVTYEDSTIVARSLEILKRTTGLTPYSIIEDSVLHRIFPHSTVPHEVWIAPDGTFQYITDNFEVSEKNISSILQGKSPEILTKLEEKQIKIDYSQPLLTGIQADKFGITKNDYLVHSEYSTMIGYRPNFGGGTDITDDYINFRNTNILRLLQFAYGNFQSEFTADANNRTIIDVKDSSLLLYPSNLADSKNGRFDLAKYNDWQRTHVYCYELIKKNNNVINPARLMQKDLDEYFVSKFGLHTKLEKRLRKCWVLVKLSDDDKLKSIGGEPSVKLDAFSFNLTNMKFINFIGNIRYYFFPRSLFPLIDGTGYSGNVDIDINCNLSDIDELNTAIEKYGLKFILQEKLIDMIVITDKLPN